MKSWWKISACVLLSVVTLLQLVAFYGLISYAVAGECGANRSFNCITMVPAVVESRDSRSEVRHDDYGSNTMRIYDLTFLADNGDRVAVHKEEDADSVDEALSSIGMYLGTKVHLQRWHGKYVAVSSIAGASVGPRGSVQNTEARTLNLDDWSPLFLGLVTIFSFTLTGLSAHLLRKSDAHKTLFAGEAIAGGLWAFGSIVFVVGLVISLFFGSFAVITNMYATFL